MRNPDIQVDIWLPERTSAHIEAELVEGRVWYYNISADGITSEGEIYNHEGSHLELLEKILHGRNVS